MARMGIDPDNEHQLLGWITGRHDRKPDFAFGTLAPAVARLRRNRWIDDNGRITELGETRLKQNTAEPK